jgi:hypothetical protein
VDNRSRCAAVILTHTLCGFAVGHCQQFGCVGAPMTTIQAILLGMMLALTPSAVLLAFLLWREGIGTCELDVDLEIDDRRR